MDIPYDIAAKETYYGGTLDPTYLLALAKKAVRFEPQGGRRRA